MNTIFQCGRYQLPIRPGQMPLVMGILNVTPDSFSDGGRYHHLDTAISRAEQMIADGVDIIDIGGESSRPGALPVTLDEELRRVLPLIFALRDCGKPLSIDTTKLSVMAEALDAGVDMVNDIGGLRQPGVIDAVKDGDCGLCIMHMQALPQTMQLQPDYVDVVTEVTDFLRGRVDACLAAGVSPDRICIDPGFGFGKAQDHNVALLRHIDTIARELKLPLLAGLSRKSMLGNLTGRAVEDRLPASLGAALAAAANGAAIIRVHDVAETVDALKVWFAARGQ